MRPELKGYWQFFGRIDVGRRLVLPRAGAGRHHARQLRFPRPDAAGRRLRVRLRVRPRRVLGPARRGRGELPGRARLHRGRCGAQPSALRRLRAQQRPGGRRQSRLEARRDAQGLGRRRAARLLQRGAAPDLPGDRRGFHRRAHRARMANSSRATTRSATARSSSAPGRRARTTRRRACRATSRTTKARRSWSARRAACAAPTARTCSRRGPAITCRRSRCRPAATCSRSSAADFTLLAFDADDASGRGVSSAAAQSLGVPLKVDPRQLSRRPQRLRGAPDAGAARPLCRLAE